MFLLPTILAAQPLSDYQDGRILTFSQDNQAWFEFQDDQGFLWGRDQYGRPIRYDGYEVSVFPVDPLDPSGVQCAGGLRYLNDSEGKVWMGIGGCGLDRYNPQSGQVEHFNDAVFAVKNYSPRSYHYLFEDSRKNIWIGTQAGLYKYSRQNGAFSFASQIWHVSFIMEGRNGDIWAGNPFVGRFIRRVDTTDIRKGEQITFPFIGNPQLVDNLTKVVSPPGEQHRNLFLICYGGNLYRFDVPARAVTPQTAGLLPNELIYTVFNDGITLVGTDKNRVLQYDHEQQMFLPFLALPELPGQIDPVEHIFRTKDGILWVVTQKRTFQVLPRNTPFRKIPFPENLRQTVPYGADESLVLLKKNLYFHTVEGLQPVVEGEGAFIPLEFAEQDYDVPPQVKLYAGPPKDKSGFKFREDTLRQKLWLVLYQYPYGIKVLSFDEQGRKTFQHYCSGRDTCFNDQFGEMDIDPQGRLWLAGWAGVSCYDPRKNQFSNYTQKNGMIDLSTHSICYGRNDYVWIGCNSRGLTRYNAREDCFDYFLNDPLDATSLSTNYQIRDIEEDKAGNIWVATGSGLNRYDWGTNTFERFNEKDGLPFIGVNNIIADRNNSLWLTTPYHLVKFDPITKAFYTFGLSSGVPQSDFHVICHEDGAGRLFFQTTDGVIYFHPDSVWVDTLVPKLYFTDFQLENQSVKVNDAGKILSQSIAFTKALTLKYRQNVFTIRYAALEYLHPGETTYSFTLENFDEDWRMAGNTREATYTNLPPGDYQFMVKCRNHHGRESDPITLSITILPPWYRTWWAYGLWAFLLLGSLYAIYRFQLSRQLARAEAQQLKELDEFKSHFYTNITHEFRTPLTLILGEAKWLRKHSPEYTRPNIDRISRSGSQLLKLINEILDLSKLDAGSMSLQNVQADIILFLRYLVDSFQSLAQGKNIDLTFSAEPELFFMDFDPAKLRYVIVNLLSNAIKFTPIDGKVSVMVEAREEGLRLTVEDTGKGISKEELPRIFDRFFSLPPAPSKGGGKGPFSSTSLGEMGGTGIGLALTKELVQLMQGQLSVESELGKGSIFTVLLPVTRLEAIAEPEIELVSPASVAPETIPTGQPLVSRASDPEAPRLLIIEDSPDIVAFIVNLVKADYHILSAPDGAKGVELALAEIPDIIVSDVMMPEMDGFEVCRRIKTETATSHIPVILLTAKADLESRLEGLEYGADVYLSKPFEERELKIRLRKLLELRKRLQEKFRSADLHSIKAEPTTAAASKSPLPLQPEQYSPLDAAFLEKITGLIEKDYSVQWEVPELAQQMFVSSIQLYRKLKSLTAMPPTEFVRYIRLRKAIQLMQEHPDCTNTKIAEEVGFNSLSEFSRRFKECFGASPTEWRKALKDQSGS